MKPVKKSKMVKKPAKKPAEAPKLVRCPVCLQEVKIQDLLPIAQGSMMSFAACPACTAEIRRSMIAHALAISHYNAVPQMSAVKILELLNFKQTAKEVPPASAFEDPFAAMFSPLPMSQAAEPPPATGAAPACPDCVQTYTADGKVPLGVEVKSDGNGNPSA